MARWRFVISPKPNHRGEAFVLFGDTFVFKVYRVANPVDIARCLCDVLNATETPVNEILELKERKHA
jgi:hypothetical protein